MNPVPVVPGRNIRSVVAELYRGVIAISNLSVRLIQEILYQARDLKDKKPFIA